MTILLSAGRWLIGSTPGRILIGIAAFFIWLSVHDASLERRIRADIVAEQAKLAAERVAEMEKNNASFRNASPLDRCRSIMRDSGLPESHCSQP